MKKLAFLTLIFIFLVASCAEDNDDNLTAANATVHFNFTHNWDNTPVTNADFNTIQYTNANGENLSIEKLIYLISNVTFEKSNGETIVIPGYNLINLTTNSNLTYTPETRIPEGEYTNVSFTFGFNNTDNYGTNYPDLNTALWSVPEMMGGGYHYMQLEGKFIDNSTAEIGYAYHAIRAVDMVSDAPNLIFEDTFFTVNLGAISISNNTTVEVKMNIAEWFKNPNQWDLNLLHTDLMSNFNAQVMMYENGQNVFSLGTITP
ncbi:MAG TPA: MbnP family protein [Flavobacteriaceae bacterium]|nr:MbnP family protein [Flavobacteriaceae bacterium]